MIRRLPLSRSPEAQKPRVNTQDNAKPNPIVLENEEKIVENENSKANANATKKLTARTDPSHLQIFVLTRRDSFDLRKAITDSWAKPFKNNVTFMVGDYCPNPPHTRETWVCRLKPGSEMGEDFHTEQETYQNNEQLLNQKIFNETSNTALLDFYDTYRNLTLKLKDRPFFGSFCLRIKETEISTFSAPKSVSKRQKSTF